MDSGRDEPGRSVGRRAQFLEVLAFLFLIVPSMILSMLGSTVLHADFSVVAVAVMLRELPLLALVLFFVWRNGEGLGALGWTGRNIGREILLGTALYVPFVFFMIFVKTAFEGLGLSSPQYTPSFLIPSGVGDYVLAVLFVAVVAVAEETVFRGYLVRRFLFLTDQPLVAVVLSAAIFSLGHAYEGTAGMGTVAVAGAVFAAIYLWRGSLVAPMVMHFLQDFFGIVVAPLLGS